MFGGTFLFGYFFRDCNVACMFVLGDNLHYCMMLVCSRFKHKLCIVLCGSQRSASAAVGQPKVHFNRWPCRKRWRVTVTLAKVRSWLPSQSSTRFVESKSTLASWSKFTLADRLKSIFHSRSMSILHERSGSTCLRFTWVACDWSAEAPHPLRKRINSRQRWQSGNYGLSLAFRQDLPYGPFGWLRHYW